jgi:hypothetical protein
MCMMSPSQNYPVSEVVEALKQACREMPLMDFYGRLRDMQGRGAISLQDYSSFLAEQFDALGKPAGSTYMEVRMLEVRWRLAAWLAEIAAQNHDEAGAQNWNRKAVGVRDRLKK